MKVVLTGGGGLLGRNVAAMIASEGAIGENAVDELVLADIRPLAPPAKSRVKVRVVSCDVRDPGEIKALIGPDTNVVFHLAAIMSELAESNFSLGWAINLEGTRHVLEACRALAKPPRLIFTSTAAIYGENQPDPVPDDAAIHPSNTYGTQKAMCELMIEEYSRRGFVDGRIIRVAHVAVRDDDTHQGAGAFLTAIVKGPLAGRPTVCPVPVATRVAVTTPATVLASLRHVAGLPSGVFPGRRIVQLPALTLTIDDLLAAVGRAGGNLSVIKLEPDAQLLKLLDGIPAAYVAARAISLGFPKPPAVDGMIAEYSGRHLTQGDRNERGRGAGLL